MPVARRSRQNQRRQNQRGSALLVVLVFAAIIAIMLYREMPIAAFEAQRQKEELLVARGNEYKRGVKLFVRKIGRFPSTLAELENTNRMRFLRHRFVDPMTGKDDWRMIHAGPGGVIVDSKVASTTTKSSNALGQGATFAGFNNSFTGDTTAAAALAADNTPSAGMRQRPPATKNAGDASNADPLAAAAGAGGSNDPNNANAANIDPVTGQPVPGGQGTGNSANSVANAVTNLADQLNNTNPKTPAQAGNPAAAGGLANTSTFGNGPTFGNTSTFGNTQNGTAGNQGSNQITAAGGIAGVASNAEGKSIKLVHDQKKYKLWEFYYDMRQEQQAGIGAVTAANGVGVTSVNPALATSGFGQSPSSFGSGNTSNSGSGTTSSFGNSAPPAPPPSGTQPPTPQSP